MKKIAVLGSTGSVGINVLKVVRGLKEQFKVVGLSANHNVSLLAKQINEFNPAIAAINNEEKARLIKGNFCAKTRMFGGPGGLIRVATCKEADLIVMCISGSGSLLPLVAAIEAGKQIALASKEAIVMAGEIIDGLCKKYRVKIIPVDSEHSAIFQCLNGKATREVRRLILTGSGGPFNLTDKDKLKYIHPRQALKHPRWHMGRKITIDSATLMNKGLEIIEARWLFGIPVGRIDVLIHPEAVVHSMVEFIDGNILALMGAADMRLPIQYALTYPKREKDSLPRLDLAKLGKLTFSKPDYRKFPCLQLAREAAEEGKSFPCVLNAADETCVGAFLRERIKFNQIPEVIKKVIDMHRPAPVKSIREILLMDTWARARTEEIIGKFGA